MDMIKERSIQRIATSNYLLTGLVYCGKCGAKMRYQKWGKYGVKLACYSQQKSKPYLIKDPNCDNEKIWADEVEDAVVKDLFRMSIEQNQNKKIEQTFDTIDLLRQQYDVCSNKIKRLYNLYAQSSNDLLLSTIEENQEELKNIQTQINKEQERKAITNKMIETKKMISNIKDAWDYMTIQERQNLVHQCVEKIVINDNNVDIHYKLLN